MAFHDTIDTTFHYRSDKALYPNSCTALHNKIETLCLWFKEQSVYLYDSFIPTILHSLHLQLTVLLHKMSLASQLTKNLFILTISSKLHFIFIHCKISFDSFLHHIRALHKIMYRKGSSQIRPLLPPPFCHISNKNDHLII